MNHPILGRADLVVALASGHSQIVEAVARQLGLERRPTIPAEPRRSESTNQPSTASLPKLDSSGYPTDVDDMALWVMTGFRFMNPLDQPEDEEPTTSESRSTAPLPRYRPLAQWNVIGPRLRQGLSEVRAANQPDIKELIGRYARRELISDIPRQGRRRWGELLVVCDTSFRLLPFRFDQTHILAHLRRLIPEECLQVIECSSPFYLRPYRRDGDATGFGQPESGSHLLILGDLGCLDDSPQRINQWVQWGRTQRVQACRLQALVPCSLEPVPHELRELYAIQSWQRDPLAHVADHARRLELVEQILTLAAPALRLEPGLLRELRQLIPAAVDASLEVDVWNSPLLSSNHPVAATIDRQLVKEKLRPQFEALPADLRRAALYCIRNWRRHLDHAPEIWREEVLSLDEDSRSLLPAQDIKDARATIREFNRRRATAKSESLDAWWDRVLLRLSEPAYSDKEVGRMLRDARREVHPQLQTVAAGTDPREIPAEQECSYRLQVNDRQIEFVPDSVSSTATAVEHAVAHIRSSNQYFRVDSGQFWKTAQPDYVSAFGTDPYGAWFEFEIPSSDHSTVVTQRMRWIPAFEFLMGSPEGEEGRWDDEGPQHNVTLSRGYWLADTPCTQAVWQAVMDNNPSRFKREQRPVEQVSWEDAQEFCKQLQERIPGLSIGLPTEAQWEFACRAGTCTKYWFGDECRAEHANFGGSIGETTDAMDYPANPHGLFDMHGNVDEWVQDWWGAYPKDAQFDPHGPASGSVRVIRGGGWSSDARFLRSAFRFRFGPGVRDDYLGFRCLSQSVAEPTEAASRPVAEQGPQLTRVGGAGVMFEATTLKVSTNSKTDIATAGASSLTIRSDLEHVELQRLSKPTWAKEFGRDPFGVYADFEITAECRDPPQPVRQRMRWIPPGHFVMGSPNDEVGRNNNETQRPVTLSEGFWMFDTPCTQELWSAVMDDNPSYFEDPLRPVEQVDWVQACRFAELLNTHLPALGFRLPTEAQWEYACRAGTATAIYSGELEILGDANAPALDAIAWYGGNSGHEYDLEKSRDISSYDWLSDKQYEFTHAGTRRVKQKHANPWGLYDMLGNVWEWCHDWYGDYEQAPCQDPPGPEEGSLRVFRGGGWLYFARYLRSAYRYGYDPGVRSDGLGFRCLSSVSRVAERENALTSEPRDEAAEKRRTE